MKQNETGGEMSIEKEVWPDGTVIEFLDGNDAEWELTNEQLEAKYSKEEER
jgi:hypothetical protein